MSRTDLPPPLAARLARGGIEAILLALVVLSPWAFGSVHPLALLFLYAGIGVALLLWAVVLVTEGPPRLACPVALCLVGMVLLGVLQLAPLPSSVLGVVAPGSEKAWSSLLPDQPQQQRQALRRILVVLDHQAAAGGFGSLG